MELIITIVFSVMMALATVNYVLASFQKQEIKKISKLLEAMLFLLIGIVLQIVG